MEENKNIVLKIEGISNIKYEEPEEFRTSISYKYYKQALKMTEEILKNNFAISKKEGERYSQLSGTDLRNSNQLYNIIFFTGDRGAGKTSAMLSYMEFLKDYYRNVKREMIKDNDLKIPLDGREVMFTGLEYIDASMLDDKEDILGSVLSKMLKKWLDEEKNSQGGIIRNSDYEHKKRKLQKLFSTVYECRKKIRDTKDYTEENSEMFMDNLKNMSITFNMRKEFRKLVYSYLDIMRYPGAEYLEPQSHFLVICIDDLDMNIRKGFELLEQVRKYLMIPNIIVLLSANYEQLDKICNNHYFKEFDKTKSNDMGVYIENLSREYLEKIIPVQRQIVMSSGEKWLLMKENNLKIQYKDINNESFEESGKLKEIVRKTLEERLRIMWNIEGMSLNYLTPTTLRELCAWVIEISSLVIDDERNVERFLEEEFFRLCKKYLSSEEQRHFVDAEKVDIESRMLILYNVLFKYTNDFEKIRVQNPKLGDVLELVSYAQKLELKAVVFGTLTSIYFTLKIKMILRKMQLLEDKKQKEAQIRLLDRYYGKGIWGEWESKIIGGIAITDNNNVVIKRIDEIARYKSDNMTNSLQLTLNGSYDLNDVESIKQFLQKNGKELINYQYMLLFYNLDADENSVIWKSSSKKDATQTTITLTRQYKGMFSLSNALLNMQFKRGIAFRFLSEFGKIMKFTEKKTANKQEIQEELNKYSIWNDVRLSENQQIMPLENMECLINMAQTIQERLGKERLLYEYGIDDVIKKYFDAIGDVLQINEPTCYEYYRESPLIKKIENTAFRKMLRNSILLFVPKVDIDAIESWMGGSIHG